MDDSFEHHIIERWARNLSHPRDVLLILLFPAP